MRFSHNVTMNTSTPSTNALVTQPTVVKPDELGSSGLTLKVVFARVSEQLTAATPPSKHLQWHQNHRTDAQWQYVFRAYTPAPFVDFYFRPVIAIDPLSTEQQRARQLWP
jgi:hypothetical protein